GSFDHIAVTREWIGRPRGSPARLDADVKRALSRAAHGQAISDEEALALFQAEGDALDDLCRVADDLRREAVGDEVTYVVNRNINFTNVCYTGCRFCAFAQREVDAESYTLSLEEVADRAQEPWDDGVRWVLTKGKLPADSWEEIVKTAHSVGIRSSSTIMYGHVDAPPHWVAHIRRLARIQGETGGFTEFVPLPFVWQNSPIYLAG